MILFSNKNEKMLQEIAEEMAGEVAPQTFFQVYKKAMQGKHDFLFVDLQETKPPISLQKKSGYIFNPRIIFCASIIQAMDTVTETVQKKPRTEAQMAALENARRKALQMRAQKTALKKQEEADKATAVVEAQKQPIEEPPTPPVVAEELETPVEPEEEIEYVKKARSRPKPKKRIVVVEESSDE